MRGGSPIRFRGPRRDGATSAGARAECSEPQRGAGGESRKAERPHARNPEGCDDQSTESDRCGASGEARAERSEPKRGAGGKSARSADPLAPKLEAPPGFEPGMEVLQTS